MRFGDTLILAVALALLAYAACYCLLLRRSPDPAMGITLALLPYWTLAGALPVLLAKRQEPTLEYSYLEGRLFPIFIDNTYALTLLIYTIFLGASLALIAVFTRPESKARRKSGLERWRSLSVRFSHPLLLAGAGVLLVVKLAIVVYLVRTSGSASLYEATRVVRGGQSRILRIYQYLNFVVAYPLTAGFALWLCFPHARAMVRRPARSLMWALYVTMLLTLLAENALLGNRAVPLVMMAGVAAAWFRWRYLPATRARRRPLQRRFLVTAFLGFLVIGTIGISRGGSLDSPSAVVGSLTSNVVRVGNVAIQSTRSAEKLAAHMSLYGVIDRDAGIRLQPLAPNSYAVYTKLVDAPPDQVFTVHYVTAWWLRLGPLGLLPAVLTFALAVAILQRLATRAASVWSAGFSLAAATLPAAGIPITILRSGPESLRAVFIELLLLPGLVLVPCFVLGRKRSPGVD